MQVRRRCVDATCYGTSVPSTHRPAFRVAEGARLATPNDLPQLWKRPERLPAHFVILGAGKTAMGVYLLQCGARPEQIRWVRPRDASIRACRLHGFGKLIDAVDPADAAKLAVLARLRAASRGVSAAAAKWMA